MIPRDASRSTAADLWTARRGNDNVEVGVLGGEAQDFRSIRSRSVDDARILAV